MGGPGSGRRKGGYTKARGLTNMQSAKLNKAQIQHSIKRSGTGLGNAGMLKKANNRIRYLKKTGQK